MLLEKYAEISDQYFIFLIAFLVIPSSTLGHYTYKDTALLISCSLLYLKVLFDPKVIRSVVMELSPRAGLAHQ